MKVLLMDLDLMALNKRRRPFPNLALMKLSAHHKGKGDEVYLNFPLKKVDIVYASCVFTWNREKLAEVPHMAAIGGSGVEDKSKLPAWKFSTDLPYRVEHIMPDYDLYPSIDFSMGFTSRGCIRQCPWCKVPENEGGIKVWDHFQNFWNHRHSKILLLDNNLLAADNWRETLLGLADAGVEVDFNQGLDIRLIDEEVTWYLNRVRTKRLRFAFDSLSYEWAVRNGIEILTAQGISPRKLSFYVLVGFKDDETWLDRMKLLASYDVDVYPMLYKDDDGKEPELNRKEIPNVFWHGGRNNIRKLLRVAGRLP